MLSHIRTQMQIQFYQDICSFLQKTTFAHQFRFLPIAKTHRDIVTIVIDPCYQYSIFRISKNIFSVTRQSCMHSTKDKKMQVENALIECFHDAFSIIDYVVEIKNTVSSHTS